MSESLSVLYVVEELIFLGTLFFKKLKLLPKLANFCFYGPKLKISLSRTQENFSNFSKVKTFRDMMHQKNSEILRS